MRDGRINRRVLFRLPVRLDARFRWVGARSSGPWQDGMIENLSAGGMRMVADGLDAIDDNPVLTGDTALQIQFSLDGAGDHLDVAARVAWLERGDDGKRRAGIQFTGLGDEGQRVLDRFVLDHCRPGSSAFE